MWRMRKSSQTEPKGLATGIRSHKAAANAAGKGGNILEQTRAVRCSAAVELGEDGRVQPGTRSPASFLSAEAESPGADNEPPPGTEGPLAGACVPGRWAQAAEAGGGRRPGPGESVRTYHRGKVSTRPGAGCRDDAGERCAGRQRGKRAGQRGAARGAAVATEAVRRGAPWAREGRAGAFGNGDGPGRRGSGTTAAAARGHNPGGGRRRGEGRGRSTDPPSPVASLPRGGLSQGCWEP